MAEHETKPDDNPGYYGGLGELKADDILNAAGALGTRISESGVYADYGAALARVNNNPDLWSRIEEFKRVQTDYGRGEISLDQEKHLSKLYFDLCANPDAEQFLNAEKKMLALMISVHERLWEGCLL
jgi:cell fate (sporulation/competence/biofilm development) regulator YlbF (YheA/YmcA/DUF963 family)